MERTALIVAIVVIVIIALGAAYFLTRAPPETTPTPTPSPSPSPSPPPSPSPTPTPSPTTTPTPSPSPTPPSPTPTPTPTPKVAEKLVIGTTDKVTDIDPSNAYDFFTWEVLNNIMEGLVRYEPGTDKLVPALAERWEVKEDGKVWVFYLRKDAKFCDGKPVTAHDVVRSIKRVMTIQGDPSWLVTEFVEDVEAIDDYTVKFTLKKPVGFFLAVVATAPYFTVHPNYPDNEIVSDATWGGPGPYCIKEFKRDEYIVLEANPYYHGDKPKTKTVIIRFYKDATTLRLALERGEIDVAWRTLRPIDYVELEKDPRFKTIEVPGSFIRYLVIKVDIEPTSNKLVRQAIAAALDRRELAEVVFMGTMEPLYSMVPRGLWSHIEAFKEKYGDANIDLARELLQKAGYSEDNKVKIELWYTPTHYGDTEADLATLIKDQLERTGMIEVEIKSSEWATYVDQLRKGQMMICLLGWYPDYVDPDNFLTPFLHSGANKWTGTGYANPEMDKILDQAATAPDQATRTKLYEDAQRLLAEDAPFIPILQGKLYIVTQKNVEGVKVGPSMLLPYYTMYKVEK